VSHPIRSRFFFTPLWLAIWSFLIFTAAIAGSAAIRRHGVIAISIFAVAAAALIAVLVIAGRRRRESLLFCEALPIRIGHPFKGSIDVRLRAAPDDTFSLVLRCTTPPAARTGTRVTVYKDELEIDSHQWIEITGGVRLFFTFDMPAEGDPTTGRIRWTLEVTKKGLAAQFPLMVVPSDGPAAVPDEMARPFAAVRNSLRT